MDQEVTKVLVAIENAIWPDLFIAGGGISRKADKWVPLLKNRTPVVAAALLNSAGIVGAAMAMPTAPRRDALNFAALASAYRPLSLQWSTAAA